MAMEKKDKKKGVRAPVTRLTDPEERKKALATAMEHIEKSFGEGSVMLLGQNKHMDIETISTGSLTLDLALGVGGLPRGRIIELYGAESSGKTTIALHAVAETQKSGGTAAFVDVEHALDPIYAKALGVDIDNLIVSQPDTGEQALEIIEALVRSGAIDMIVLDSVAAMVTRAEIEGNMGDAVMGAQARLMSGAMRKLTSSIGKTNTVAIFINQVREKIGISFGNPEVTPGGRALKFYSSVRISVSRGEAIKGDDGDVGRRPKCKVVKNKVAPPFKECEFDIIFGQGISKTGEILDLAVDLKIAKKSGAWFSYNDNKLGQGREKSKAYLDENPDIKNELEQKIRENYDPHMLDSTDDEGKDKTTIEEKESIIEKVVAEDKKKKSTKGKKSVIIEADDDFEEFSPEDL
mgnify:CR=1 FL=1